jgi:Fur family ferric uptake transcriptional regulator
MEQAAWRRGVQDRSADLRELLATYIRENRLKNTRQRDVILESFLKLDGHITIDGLLACVQLVNAKIGYATVYRSLKLFVAAGVASEQRFGDGPALYEPTERGEHHDHLICTRCGRIFEFEDKVIEARQEAVASDLGVHLTHHRMTLWGECEDLVRCREYSDER